jgi:hypothetical protein
MAQEKTTPAGERSISDVVQTYTAQIQHLS